MPGIVMTVTGPVDPAELGVTDAHDHLFLRSPALAGQEIEQLEPVVQEVADGHRSGIRTIVEMTPIGLGRRPDLMRAVSERTGVKVVAATGYHRDAHYTPDHWVHEASEDELLEHLVVDIEDGMHPADWNDPALPLDEARAGVIKAGASYQRVTRSERRRLVAVGEASRRTGVPILTHTEVGTAGDEIVELLTAAGVAPDRIILAHLDRNPDLEVHAQLAERGVFIEYDTLGRIKYRPDVVLLDLIEAMFEAGHGQRVLLGLDLGRRDYYRSFDGGPGMGYLMDVFLPRLRRRVGDRGVQQVLVDNPARALVIG